MIHVSEFLSYDALRRCVKEGLVSARTDETGEVWIYNYTPWAQARRVWTPETMAARGLILDSDGYVIARPFPKFFNLNEPDAPALPDRPFTVAEKADGSLGIVYRHPVTGEVRVATRGSLGSDQARWATAFWQRRYADIEVPEGLTPLVEIIYPRNRIVVDYGDFSDLVLLAVIDNATGADAPTDAFAWPGPKAKTHHFDTVDELVAHVAADEGENSEGFVVAFDSDGSGPNVRVKLKYPTYLKLHRAVFGLDTLEVWKVAALAAALRAGIGYREAAAKLRLNPDEAKSLVDSGDPVSALRDPLPDELWEWFDTTLDEFRSRIAADAARHLEVFAEAKAEAEDGDPGDFRRRFAAAVSRRGRDVIPSTL